MSKFGMFGKLRAQPGQRDALAAKLLEAARMVEAAEGCEIYLVGLDTTDKDVIWVTELWSTEAAHDASLDLPGVRELIATAMPLIAGAPEGTHLEVLGGVSFEAGQRR